MLDNSTNEHIFIIVLPNKCHFCCSWLSHDRRCVVQHCLPWLHSDRLVCTSSSYSLWKSVFFFSEKAWQKSLRVTKTITYHSLSIVTIWMRTLKPIVFVWAVRTDHAVNDICQGLENIQGQLVHTSGLRPEWVLVGPVPVVPWPGWDG